MTLAMGNFTFVFLGRGERYLWRKCSRTDAISLSGRDMLKRSPIAHVITQVLDVCYAAVQEKLARIV